MITTLAFQYYPQLHILSYFYKLPRALSLSKMFVEFSFKLFYSTTCGKKFQIYGVLITRKCIDLRHFYSCPSPTQNSLPRQKETTHSTRQHSFEKVFPLTAERCGGNYDLLYQNSVRKYENDWNIRFFIFCMICNFLKPDGFTVL